MCGKLYTIIELYKLIVLNAFDDFARSRNIKLNIVYANDQLDHYRRDLSIIVERRDQNE